MLISFLGAWFFITLASSAFTLRGIWGHNLGGGVMGILIGLGLGVLLDLPILLSIELMFWLGITWAISGIVGWARHATMQRFIRGYLIYGMLPNLVIGIILYANNALALVEMALFGPIGMGIGFGISYKLLLYIRKKMEEHFKRKNPSMNLNWGTRPVKEGEISHIYVFQLDTWKVFFEILSGALYAATSLVVYSVYPVSTSFTASLAMEWYHFFMLLVCCILVPLGLALDVIKERTTIKGFKLPCNQRPWNRQKGQHVRLVALLITTSWGVLFFVFVDFFMSTLVLFLVMYWLINGIGRLYNPLDSKLFQTDCLIDTSMGIIITSLAFLI